MPRVILPTTFNNSLLPVRDFSIFTDTFERANGAIGSTPSGLAWTLSGATGTIDTGNAYAAATVDNTFGTVLVNAGTANGVLKATLSAVGQYNIALVLRGTDPNNCLFLTSFTNTDLTGWRLMKRVAGAEGAVASNVGPMAAGNNLEMTMNGTALTLKINGVQTWAGTVTDHATGTRFGIGAKRTSNLGVRWGSIRMDPLPA